MDIRCLKYFVSVAKHMNFTRAAKECFISQTAMSQHISKMEEELGFKLFYRNNRYVELTPGGKVFLEEATNLLRKFDHAVFWSSVASMDYTGQLRVGFLLCGKKIPARSFKDLPQQESPGGDRSRAEKSGRSVRRSAVG